MIHNGCYKRMAWWRHSSVPKACGVHSSVGQLDLKSKAGPVGICEPCLKLLPALLSAVATV